MEGMSSATSSRQYLESLYNKSDSLHYFTGVSGTNPLLSLLSSPSPSSSSVMTISSPNPSSSSTSSSSAYCQSLTILTPTGVSATNAGLVPLSLSRLRSREVNDIDDDDDDEYGSSWIGVGCQKGAPEGFVECIRGLAGVAMISVWGSCSWSRSRSALDLGLSFDPLVLRPMRPLPNS